MSSAVVPSKHVDRTFAPGTGIRTLPPAEASIPSGSRKPTIAIISLGEMGSGIATLLRKYSYPIVTNLDGRSAKTRARVEGLGVEILPLPQIMEEASMFLSVVPPAEAHGLAKTVAKAYQDESNANPPGGKLTYVDLNAMSPELARRISKTITGAGMDFLDGALLGFPPKEFENNSWFLPAMLLAGPKPNTDSGPWTEELLTILNVRHVGDDYGGASGLKACFSGIAKGQAAVGIQAYTTAESLGVLPALREHMMEYLPSITPVIESSMFNAQRKAYRWIKEMDEIEETFAKEGAGT
ncbi:putative 28.5 kDa protein in 7S RNA 5'region [Lachnellula suecica]|uniref:Putative 28.5 kDa protein in 7S RNA 5'region n=1 Tax=Lachnellula suecica TaxID=602035 RepID=A0A8T9CFZ9_9HELO|nr:putative 28.5 kDa protein in 7S RNA 5'region [Lachnellula suecica]